VGLDDFGQIRDSLYRLAARVEECEKRLETLEARALSPGVLPREIARPLGKLFRDRSEQLDREQRQREMEIILERLLDRVTRLHGLCAAGDSRCIIPFEELESLKADVTGALERVRESP
jgi:hypothetical protein